MSLAHHLKEKGRVHPTKANVKCVPAAAFSASARAEAATAATVVDDTSEGGAAAFAAAAGVAAIVRCCSMASCAAAGPVGQCAAAPTVIHSSTQERHSPYLGSPPARLHQKENKNQKEIRARHTAPCASPACTLNRCPGTRGGARLTKIKIKERGGKRREGLKRKDKCVVMCKKVVP